MHIVMHICIYKLTFMNIRAANFTPVKLPE
jgi:hypothetical protein